MIIGQKRLLNQINQYNIDTFPRTTMFIGERGIGKHTFVNVVKDEILKLPLIDLTTCLSNEVIDEIYIKPTPCIYLIDTTKLVDAKQNAILKLIEEPPVGAFIILLAEEGVSLLNTVRNRCVVFEFEPYTKDELRTFITNETDVNLILNILRTPGKIIGTNINNLKEAYEIADKIVHKLAAANYANTLTISDKINFEDNYNKIDLEIFFDVLADHMFKCYYNENDSKILDMYLFTVNARKTLTKDPRTKREHFFENFITELWLKVRGG